VGDTRTDGTDFGEADGIDVGNGRHCCTVGSGVLVLGATETEGTVLKFI
jgi:hypothetical protein